MEPLFLDLDGLFLNLATVTHARIRRDADGSPVSGELHVVGGIDPVRLNAAQAEGLLTAMVWYGEESRPALKAAVPGAEIP